MQLIKAGKAYVDDLTADQIREYRGTLTEPGRDSPYRDRSVEENLDLFARMRAGEFPDGAKTLRAKIDMASPNLNLRDPVMYRIRKATHHRTGDKWCIYPMYDWAHGQSRLASRASPTRSARWSSRTTGRSTTGSSTRSASIHPQQIEFARLNLTYTVLSKRKLLQLVEERPRRAAGTIRACRRSPACAAAATRRRRSATSASASAWPSSTASSSIALLEHCLREDLNKRAGAAHGRAAAAASWSSRTTPRARSRSWRRSTTRKTRAPGTRKVPFSRELYIEQDDFRETRPPKYFRLVAGRRGAPALRLLRQVHRRDARTPPAR